MMRSATSICSAKFGSNGLSLIRPFSYRHVPADGNRTSAWLISEIFVRLLLPTYRV